MNDVPPGDFPTALHRPLPALCLLASLLLTAVVTACGGGNGAHATAPAIIALPPSSAPALAPAAHAWPGHYFGTVKIAGGEYFGDVLLTADGKVSLYVGGLYASDGTTQMTRADSGALLVGTVSGSRSQAAGSGRVLGLNCANAPVPGRFCGAATDAMITIDSGASDGKLVGEVHVTTSGGDEIWTLGLWALDNYYLLPSYSMHVAQDYQESVAEFAGDSITDYSVDANGQWSFQSASSGCIGKGTFTPHLDGIVNVYDVALTITGCLTGYAYLNGVFEGLATTMPSSYWGYDDLLRVWLSKPEGDPTPAALILLSVDETGYGLWDD